MDHRTVQIYCVKVVRDRQHRLPSALSISCLVDSGGSPGKGQGLLSRTIRYSDCQCLWSFCLKTECQLFATKRYTFMIKNVHRVRRNKFWQSLSLCEAWVLRSQYTKGDPMCAQTVMLCFELIPNSLLRTLPIWCSYLLPSF